MMKTTVPVHDADGSLAYAYVTPGRLDREAVRAYTRGHCHALALALHDETAWTIVGDFRDLNIPSHVAVVAPDGQLVDINLAAHGRTAPTTRLVEMTSGDVWRLIRGGDFYAPDLALAASFVPTILTCMERGGSHRPAAFGANFAATLVRSVGAPWHGRE